jgi:hypothetical protein
MKNIFETKTFNKKAVINKNVVALKPKIEYVENV